MVLSPAHVNLHPSNKGEARKGEQTASLWSSLTADQLRWYILLCLACRTWNTWHWKSDVNREHDEVLSTWKENGRGCSLFSHPHVEPCSLGNSNCNFYYYENNHTQKICVFAKKIYFWITLIFNFWMSYLMKNRKAGNSVFTTFHLAGALSAWNT